MKTYNDFIVEGRAAGFTDQQINFLWDWINERAKVAALSGGLDYFNFYDH